MHDRGSLLVRIGTLGLCAAALLLAAQTSRSDAQSTNASPVIIIGSTEVDPATLPFLADDARHALTNAIANLKAGTTVAHVMATSPNKTGWASKDADNTNFVNIEDLARQSLEICEYLLPSCLASSCPSTVTTRVTRTADGRRNRAC